MNKAQDKRVLSSTASTQTSLEAIRKGKDIIFHGVEFHCNFTEELLELLKSHKLWLVAHTHPDYGNVEPSPDDREFLRHIGQKESIVISYITGVERRFSTNLFDEF